MPKKILFLLIAAAALFLGWRFYFPQTHAENPVLTLSEMIDRHISVILGPLMAGPLPVDSHELRKLSETLRDGALKSPPEHAKVYLAASKLCDTLMGILDERESHVLRINNIHANSSPSRLSKNPEQDRQNTVRFFVNGVEHSWVQKAKVFRNRINQQYAELRKLERSSNFGLIRAPST
jgi:hypothetical protein